MSTKTINARAKTKKGRVAGDISTWGRVQIPATPPHNLAAMKEADLNKLARLIKICGFLMQANVCLFWEGE